MVAGSLTYNTNVDTNGFQKGINDINGKAQAGGTKLKTILGALGIAKIASTAIGKITENLDGAINRLDTMNNFTKVMSNLGIGAEESQKAIDKLSEGLKGIPTKLDAGALSVQRFTAKNGDVQKSADLFLAVNDAILAGGASTQIQENALEQLTQAYSRGKFEMDEWRNLQIAMPAQLKQIADVMGLDVDALGEMMRQGDDTEETIDKFIDTIMRMDKEGVKGFKSLKEQARNATGGIKTNITNMNTAISRGIAKVIESASKATSKAGLGSIADIIANIGKKAEDVLKKIADKISKIDLKKLIDTLKKLLPVITAVVAGFVSYEVALNAIHAINIVNDIISATKVFLGLVPAITSATVSQEALNMAMSVNPIGLVISAVGALTAALVIFGNKQSEVDEEVKKTDETLKNYKDTMEQIEDAKDKQLSKSMNEIYYYQSLEEELQNITDENGKVKDGYEDRAKFITTELSNALGIEIDLTDGVIQNYQDIQKEIDKTLEKKKAEAYFNAHEEEYNEALKQEADLHKEIERNVKNRNTSSEKMNDLLDKQIEYDDKFIKYKDELLKYYKKEIEYDDLSKGAKESILDMSINVYDALNKESEAYEKYTKRLEKSNKTYADNEVAIDRYRRAQEALANGNYDAVSKIFNDTVTFNGKTETANNETYEKAKESRQQYLDFLLEHQDVYGEEFIKKEQERIDKELKELEKEKDEANKAIEKKNKQMLDTTTTGINDQLKAIDKKYEFKQTADGNMQFYVDGIAKGKPVSRQKAQEVTNEVIKKFNEGKLPAENVGKEISKGLAKGITAMSSAVTSAASAVVNQAIQAAKEAGDIHSPSRKTYMIGKYFDEGLEEGIKDYSKGIYNEVDNLTNEVLDKFSNAVNLETSNMSFSGTSGSVSQILSANATFEGTIPMQIDLDGEKIYDNQQKISARKNLQYGGVK